MNKLQTIILKFIMDTSAHSASKHLLGKIAIPFTYLKKIHEWNKRHRGRAEERYYLLV